MGKVYFSIISILLLNSCCFGEREDENTGLIVSPLLKLTYETCLGNLPDTGCIRNQAEFDKIFHLDSLSYCKDLKVPTIDFSKNSVLINLKYDDKIATFSRNVSVDSLSKEITYLVSINRTNCFCYEKCEGSLSYNIVLVPKIDSTFKVIYK